MPEELTTKMLKDTPLHKVVEVEVPSKTLAQRLEEAAKAMATTASFEGFRKGKVPISLVKSRFGENLRNRVTEQLASSQINGLMKKFERGLLTQPSLEIVKSTDTELVFRLSFSLLPEVPEVDFSTLTLTKPALEVTPQNVDKALEQLVARNPIYKPAKDRTAQRGDMVKVISAVDVKGIGMGEAEHFEGIIGGGNFFVDIENTLLGKKSGWTGKVSLVLPENPQNKRLSGKPAVFHIKLESVALPTKAKADEEFAKNLKYADLAALKRELRNRLQDQANQIIQSDLRTSLAEQISTKYPFELPAQLLQSSQPSSPPNPSGDQPTETAAAKKARLEKTAAELRLQFVIQKLMPQHKVGDEELKNALASNEAYLKAQPQENGGTGGQALTKEQKQQLAARLTNILSERKVLNHIYSRATITASKAPPATQPSTKPSKSSKPSAKPATKEKATQSTHKPANKLATKAPNKSPTNTKPAKAKAPSKTPTKPKAKPSKSPTAKSPTKPKTKSATKAKTKSANKSPNKPKA